MPRLYCAIPGCGSKQGSIKFFNIPRSESLRRSWMKYILPLNPALQKLSPTQLTPIKICSLHFEAKCLKGNKRLSNSIPTLFTKEEIELGKPSNPVAEKPLDVTNDHSYFNKPVRSDHNYSKAPDEEELDRQYYSLGDTADTQTQDDVDNCGYDGICDDGDTRVPVTTNYPQAHNKPARHQKFTQIQCYIHEFMKDIQEDASLPVYEPNDKAEKIADKLNTYNFSYKIIETNRVLKPFDKMKHLIYPDKAYAAIIYTLVKQQELFDESIRDFLSWAQTAVTGFQCIKDKVEEIFENGEFIKTSLKILDIVCKYRVKNNEIRKESIIDQATDVQIKKKLSNIPHSHTNLFDSDIMSVALNKGSIGNSYVVKKIKTNIKKTTKNDKAIQVNSVIKKLDKHVQVKPQVRKTRGVQVNTNDLDGLATATKVKKKDSGTQTSEKDQMLSGSMTLHKNLALQTEEPIDSPINHCQKIQYVVNIKKNRNRSGKAKMGPTINPENLEPNAERISEPPNHPPSRSDTNHEGVTPINTELRQAQKPRGSKKKTKVEKRAPDPSMPVLATWDACQNLLSLGGSNRAETESEKVHSTLSGQTRTSFGKKRRPKIPDSFNEPSSPKVSNDTSHMLATSDITGISGKYLNKLHVCDSPYLLGGCKHTYDPQLESVPPIKKSRSIIKRSIVRSGIASTYSPSNEWQMNVQNLQTNTDNSSGTSPLQVLTEDNFLSRWEY